MADSAARAREPDFAALIAELVKFRDERLNREPSDRVLAKAATVSPTTIGTWLRGDSFPQQIDQLLKLLQAIRGQAEAMGLIRKAGVAALLDSDRWRRAHEAEARRRAEGTRAAVQAQQGRIVLERMRPGRPLEEVSDPFQLEVHHAIEAEGESTDLPVLPVYVQREHDRLLEAVVEQAAAGGSRIAVLVGGSSTGKTRTCWEALRPLREQGGWRLWHPIDPSHPDAVLADLTYVGPRTVVWLNEAQFYLDDALGERAAAGLRELLRDSGRAPVLVLATLWPKHWDTLTTRTTPDLHAQARELLDGHKIKVPDAFTSPDLVVLASQAANDPRLGEAAAHAQDGQITQYLAGVPVLLDRYQEAPPPTKALIHAAMDARRLGCRSPLPLTLLADAAPGYLTDAQWDQTNDDWLQEALTYVTAACKGIPGILTPVKPVANRNRRPGPANYSVQIGSGPLYRLADYLDQHGRRHRANEIPPVAFWGTVIRAHPDDLTALGEAAWGHGMRRDAAQLYKNATSYGNAEAAYNLVNHLRDIHPTDHRPARWAVIHASLDNPSAVAELLNALRMAEAHEQVAALLARDPAAHVSFNRPFGIGELLNALRRAEAHEQVAALLARDPATHASLDNPSAVAGLLNALRMAEAHEQVAALLARDPAAHVSFNHPIGMRGLLSALREAGADSQLAALAERTIIRANPDSPVVAIWLLNALQEVGAHSQMTRLAERFITQISLYKISFVARLLYALWRVGAHEQVAALLAHDPVARISFDDPFGIGWLLGALWRAEAHEQVAALLARDPAVHASLDDPSAVAALLDALREVGAHEQVAALLARDPAAHVSFNHPFGISEFLNALRAAGAHGQVATLLARDPAAQLGLEDPLAVIRLLNLLQEATSDDHFNTLVERLPGAGYFDQFVQIGDHGKRFKFGREPDGSAASSWTWDDLE
ncbi:hypothetical protein ABZ470_00565 [Streptosporangium sp. NPDC020072]|uniref:ATP-binding protein n=1 Tax=Streptosporangium sp. NPDC020072 TaxID=3154788 RepID=UPI00342C206C